MKLHKELKINGVSHPAGSTISGYMIYPFFFIHMLMFGFSGFFMAYTDEGAPLSFMFMHGGIAIFVYLIFYLAIFGRDQVKWMLINSVLGLIGIYAEISWILSLFGKTINDYPWYRHITPFFYYILYTFLIRQAVIDLCGARNDKAKENLVNLFYVVVSLIIYGLIYFKSK